MRTMRWAALLALCGILALGTTEAQAKKGGKGNKHQGGIVGLPPGHGGIPPGHGGIPPGQAKKLYGYAPVYTYPGYQPTYTYPGYAPTYSYPGPIYGGGQGWVGVPGLDAGYDEWRRNADRAYGRGDFYIQGWQQRPYPYVQPGYGWPR